HTTQLYPLSLHDALPILVENQIAEHEQPPGSSRIENPQQLAVGHHTIPCTLPGPVRCSVTFSHHGRSPPLRFSRSPHQHAQAQRDRKSTRLNSSHVKISY